ncbi:GGDEF domain-containing protein [Shewanella sp. NIFS-20-20]|uniref:GGDEF domain-containing protein n=1 Tax=Shewanella sp. NIFS-20-20 TaxID=2853806 RepID=UPI001C4970A3|nr:GGDEF domain-containing protein [Shewanella sp. NIFS-20-20]MBV7317582.1 GGDEF domain-containing protein [Shewanella sp. NIFS-20-20]
MKSFYLIGAFASFVLSFFVVDLYVDVSKDRLNSKFLTNILFISDAIYRFNINSLNSEYVTVAKDDVSHGVIVADSHNEKVRNLGGDIDHLFSVLKNNPIISDNLWTVGVVYPEYVITKPYRIEYEDLYKRDTTNGNYLERLLTLEDIDKSLESNGLTVFETVSVFGPYVEVGTNKELFSIYYPLYLDGIVFSVLVIDVDSDFLDDFIVDFNANNFTWFELSDDHNIQACSIVEKSFALQVDNEKVGLVIKTPVIYSVMAIMICTMMLFGCFSIAEAIRKFYLDSKIDRLSGFYRKDRFINKKMSVSSICLIDIDHFKKINDVHGHVVGDIVISEVANRIKSSIRATDLAIRWGGEEFVVIFNGKISYEKLNKKANDLLSAINREKINQLDVTISIGAIHSVFDMPLQEAFLSADKALYESKNSGRNRITLYRHS